MLSLDSYSGSISNDPCIVVVGALCIHDDHIGLRCDSWTPGSVPYGVVDITSLCVYHGAMIASMGGNAGSE